MSEARPKAGMQRSSMAVQWIGAFAVAIAYAALMCVSWLQWADVLIDFGRELYVPWRITRGEVPYRDLAVFFGPLSMYVNAGWFTVFGTSLMTLALCNAALLALFTVLVFRLLLRVAGVWSATAGCIVMLSVFGFGHLQGMANYNFICPYSHELVHGIMLGVLCVAMVVRQERTGRNRDALISGVLLGLVFLTKPEPLVATGAAVVVGLMASLWRERTELPRFWRRAGLISIGALVPPIVACALLATAMPISQAARATIGSWAFIGNEELRQLPFYRFIMGTTKPGANMLEIAQRFGWMLAVFAPAVAAAWWLPVRTSRHWLLGAAAAITAGVSLWWAHDSAAWSLAARPLPLLMAVFAIALVWRLRSVRGTAAVSDDLMLRLMLIVFSGAMLLKVILHASFSHYGFALAMPATVMLAAALMDWIPSWLDGRGRAGWVFRGWAIGVLAVFLVAMQRYNQWDSSKTVDVGSGADRFIADRTRGEVVNQLLAYVRDAVPPDAAITVMPEGVMINYLSRHAAGTRYFNFLPPELAMFTERAMLDALAADPPDFIALVQRDTPEYGTRAFGQDYGAELMNWITANYQLTHQFGEAPAPDRPTFFILLLQRNAPVRP